MRLSRDRIVQLDRLEKLRYRPGTGLELMTGTTWLPLGSKGPLLIEILSAPVTVGDALERLATHCTGKAEYIDAMAVFLRLLELGVLRDPDQVIGERRVLSTGYGAPEVHVRMLDDRARVEAFLGAVRATVSPGDVVVEIGPGTGLLSVAAAKAGAARVYAIEASSIMAVAAGVFQDNDVDAIVELIPGWSTAVELGERGDVFVSELVGHDPLAERILELTIDARERFLKPGARMIPEALDFWVVPVTVPDEVLEERFFVPANVVRWSRWYGIDFGSLSGEAAWLRFLSKPEEVRDWHWACDPVPLGRIDLTTVGSPDVEFAVEVPFEKDGAFNGVALYCDLEMGDGNVLSLDPRRVGPDNHWLTPVWASPRGLKCGSGEVVRIVYSRVVGKSVIEAVIL